ncbi:uncharacterized protein EAE97_005826 [Botrytis byssoidea]|uniref:Glucose-methanol-choline oxidoreductase N-terminal domain-containing protein n=1 Tax=Botrytis byssoidea TaxID=139641 RepID=A0A9P5ISD5_9HELO|nr:uncharacterized protein EAE97_005826 [Botrytis byssoidea]KAF7943756.1 hypothetical protein EAE97_005826 [Botrytis byssoidea]
MAHQENFDSNESYDYIICGGGTSGCVIAARLAQNSNVSILIVEAGASNDTYPATAIPAAFLGGSSGCNGTLVIRGNRQDYDNWGLEGWSGDGMFKYMSKAETVRNKSWFDAEKDAHGYGGPIITSPHDPAPISKLVLESYQSMGLPLIPDMFSTGKSAHGCGHAVRTVSQGTRTMATDYITSSMKISGISIKTNIYIDRISLETDTAGALRANGVFLQDITGKKSFVKAHKEVIISAGTYGSPAILLRSGIGSKQEVEKLGIQSQVDLPGGGKISMDHLVVLSFYEVSKPVLTNNHLIWHAGGKDKSLAQYKTDKTGVFSQFPFGTFAFARLDSRLSDSHLWNSAPRTEGLDPMSLSPTQPHVEFWNTECYSPKYMFRDFPPDGNQSQVKRPDGKPYRYHPAGTCKMGRPDDTLAVLDENLKVRGITNLRVADASVMPSLIGGHPQMPVYGIAEKASDLIISDK